VTEVFSAAARAIAEGVPAVWVTVLSVAGSAPRAAGAHLLVYADGQTVGTIGGGALEFKAIACARRCRRPERLSVNTVRDLGMCCGGQVELLLEPLDVREQLWIFGAGHIGQALARTLQDLPFQVSLIDERAEWTDRAPPSCHPVTQDPRRWLSRQLQPHAPWAVVTTHDHGLDLELVEALLRGPTRWVGLIASRGKAARFRHRLQAAGLSPEDLLRLHAPVGLPIQAETPAEIAISIAAELVRRRRGQHDHASEPSLLGDEAPLPRA
jgi:xanthine dehydrogenase accessory factor